MKEVIKDIIASLTLSEPILGLVAKRTWIIADPSAGLTAYTDGLRIYINPESFSKLPDPVKMTVLAHELMHIVLKHNARAKAVKARFPELDDLTINIIADAKANQYLEGSFNLPYGFFITPRTLTDIFDFIGEEAARESSFEELCEIIADFARRRGLATKARITGIERDVVAGKGACGCEAGEDPQPHPSGGALEEGRVLNEGDPEDVSVASAEDVERRVERKYTEAVIVAKMAGRIPGWAERVLSEILKPKVQWRRLLRALLTKGMGKKVKRTWSRPSRKHPSFPGKELLKAEKVVILVDTSGSIGERELQQFLTEVYAIVKEVAEVVVVPWDAVVYEEQIIRRSSDIKGIKIKGGGGTVIRPALELVDRKYPDSMIVILSDWHIADISEYGTEELLKRNAGRIVAVTTSATPPRYLRNTIYMEVG